MLLAIGELGALGCQAHGHEGIVLRGGVVEGQHRLALSRGLEGCLLAQEDFLGFRVEDFQTKLTREGRVREVLHHGTQCAGITSPQEAGQIEASHHLLAGDGLGLQRGGHHVRGVRHAEELPCREALGQREGERHLARGGVAVQAGHKECRLIEIGAYSRGSSSNQFAISHRLLARGHSFVKCEAGNRPL